MRYKLYILLFVFLTQGCSRAPQVDISTPGPSVLLTLETSYVAGIDIVLRFKTDPNDSAVLMVNNAIGTSILNPTNNENGLSFQFPTNFAQKAGLCYWNLVSNQVIRASGTLHITPNENQTTQIETYLGPRRITAGGTDHSMLVVAPTDFYDNPLKDGTPITEKHQFKDDIYTKEIEVKNLMAWTNITSPKKVGRMLVTASCNHAISKELTTIVYPANAIDFSIEYQRDHVYADGNQIITFLSSIIMDSLGNIVSDGTLVSFSIKNSEGVLLQATGSTINGMAKAKLLHPSQVDIWEVTAYITGAAKSQILKVDFEAAVNNYDILFTKDNRTISISPIKSFMQQQIPDGMEILVSIYNSKNQLLETKLTTSKNGSATFLLGPDKFANGQYTIKFEIAGITKTNTVELQ